MRGDTHGVTMVVTTIRVMESVSLVALIGRVVHLCKHRFDGTCCW